MWGESTLCSPKFRAAWIYECGYEGIWCIAGASVKITVELVSHGTFVGTHNFFAKNIRKKEHKMFKKIYFKTFFFLLLLHVVARCEPFSSLERKLLFIALSPRQSRIHIQVMEIFRTLFFNQPLAKLAMVSERNHFEENFEFSSSVWERNWEFISSSSLGTDPLELVFGRSYNIALFSQPSENNFQTIPQHVQKMYQHYFACLPGMLNR